MIDWRGLATFGAVAMAVLEIIDAPAIEVPGVAVVFAALFLIGAWLVHKGGISGLVLLIVIALIEVVFLPIYERNNAFDWTIQIAVAVASVVCLIGCIGALVVARRPGGGHTGSSGTDL